MGKEHTSWVEVGKPLHPVLIGRKWLFNAVKCGLAGQLVRRELGCEVVRLSGEDHSAVALPKDQRLMPLGVPGCRDDPDARPDLGLTSEFLVAPGKSTSSSMV
ncbi:hypothetical protein SAMN05442782_10838 [Streptomyces sp. OK228]|nr:hypothetical protein SAMN05442782_10838 [Streptomyces sp. OK228]